MTDENPQPDVLDEAIRQVDMALEQKLEALRQTALGATRDLASATSDATPAAVSPPASAPVQVSTPAEPASDLELAPTPSTSSASDAWATSDAVLRPVETAGTQAPTVSGGFLPDEPAVNAPNSWGTPTSSGTSSYSAPTSAPAAAPTGDGDTSYATNVGLAPVVTAGDDESWAHTRTALRMLQQSSDELRDLLPAEISRRLGDELSRELTNRVTQQVSAAVGDQVERVVRTELTSPGAAIRSLQSTLPGMASDIQRGVAGELESSNAILQQVAEELPVQLERIERTVTQTVHEDVSQVERSVAENVTRLAAGLTEELQRSSATTGDGLTRVERSLDTGMRSVEGTVRGEFDRVARAMRTELDRVEGNLGEAAAAPTAAVQQLQEELPTHISRIERLVREQDPTPWVEKLADALGDQHELGKRQHEALLHDLAAANGQLGRDLEASQAELTRSLQATGDRLVGDVRASTGDVSRTLDTAVRTWIEPTARSVEDLAGLGLGELLGKLDTTVSAIESRVGHVERTVTSGIGSLQGGIDGNLSELRTQLDGRIATLEADIEQHLAQLGGSLDQDRVQRTEDLETVVDTMASGWTGMASAMRTLFSRLETIDGKLDSVTTQVAAVTSSVESMRNLETTLGNSVTSIEGLLDTQLTAVQRHLAELRPAPVVVTVNHPDAQISHETRGGYTREQESGQPAS